MSLRYGTLVVVGGRFYEEVFELPWPWQQGSQLFCRVVRAVVVCLPLRGHKSTDDSCRWLADRDFPVSLIFLDNLDSSVDTSLQQGVVLVDDDERHLAWLWMSNYNFTEELRITEGYSSRIASSSLESCLVLKIGESLEALRFTCKNHTRRRRLSRLIRYMSGLPQATLAVASSSSCSDNNEFTIGSEIPGVVQTDSMSMAGNQDQEGILATATFSSISSVNLCVEPAVSSSSVVCSCDAFAVSCKARRLM